MITLVASAVCSSDSDNWAAAAIFTVPWVAAAFAFWAHKKYGRK